MKCNSFSLFKLFVILDSYSNKAVWRNDFVHNSLFFMEYGIVFQKSRPSRNIQCLNLDESWNNMILYAIIAIWTYFCKKIT